MITSRHDEIGLGHLKPGQIYSMDNKSKVNLTIIKHGLLWYTCLCQFETFPLTDISGQLFKTAVKVKLFDFCLPHFITYFTVREQADDLNV